MTIPKYLQDVTEARAEQISRILCGIVPGLSDAVERGDCSPGELVAGSIWAAATIIARDFDHDEAQ